MISQSNGLLALGGAFLAANGVPRTALARIGGRDMKIDRIQLQTNGVARLTLRGQGGLGYVLEGSDDFRNWSTVATGIMQAFSFTVQDAQSTNFSMRLYRTQSR